MADEIARLKASMRRAHLGHAYPYPYPYPYLDSDPDPYPRPHSSH